MKQAPGNKLVTVAEMQQIEREANSSGLTYDRMMEHAGLGLAEQVHNSYRHLADSGALGLIGSGNNGGDALVALTHLAKWGWRTCAYIVRSRPVDDPLVLRFKDAGGAIYNVEEDRKFVNLTGLLKEYRVLIDGVLGTGIRLPLKGVVADTLRKVRQCIERSPGKTIVVAVDCPSGVDCDTGDAAPECIPADMTVTMAAVKTGLFKMPAYGIIGDLRVVGIGLEELTPVLQSWSKLTRVVIDQQLVRSFLPDRPVDAHKGTFGTVLVVAGSVNYTGAALLAGYAAYRCGAGLVTLAVPQPLHAALAGHFPEATWLPLPHQDGFIAKSAAGTVRNNLQRITGLLLGPGFGLHEAVQAFLDRLLPDPRQAIDDHAGIGGSDPLPPLIVDADGLKLLTRLPNWPRRLANQAILTPHPGEMSVLTGMSIQEIQSDRMATAERYSAEWGHVVVLKGAFSVIASPDGRMGLLPVATPALARAGTGDVLSGLVVGLRAQGLDAFEAAVAGAWIHAQAGLHAAKKLGSDAAVLAGDVLRGISDAMRDLS